MTRIIAGTWGGRRLATPSGPATRPTSDRVREAMFSSIESELDGLDGRRVLDLYAGSGALGLEALSRGASHADLVESDRRAAATIASNIESLAARAARLHRVPVQRFLAEDRDSYDLVMLDPPYRHDAAQTLLALVPLVTAGGLVVVERSTRSDDVRWPNGLFATRDKAYGETRLWFATRVAVQDEG